MKMFDNIAIVTGSSSGIGESFANYYLNNECKVIGIDKDVPENFFLLTNEDFRFIKIDLTNLDSYHILDEAITNITQKSITLVNCAGIAFKSPIVDSDLSNNINTLFVNAYAPLYLSTQLVKHSVQDCKITIINVSSTVAFSPIPNMEIYGATKAFLHSLTQAMQYESKDTNINVFELIPGGTNTNFPKNAGVLTKNKNLMSPDDVVEICIKSIKRGKKYVVIGFFNKLLVLLIRLVPTKSKMLIWDILISNRR